MTNLNLYIENEYKNWKIDTEKYTQIAGKIFEFYMKTPAVYENCCLWGCEYNTVSFDFLFCGSNKTRKINKQYRGKDYPADIITFAIFADSAEEERFVLELEINLGEIIIGLDKVIEEAAKKEVPKETELIFLISHGILHLLGFDHKNEDEFKFVADNQKLALKNIGIEYDKV